MYVTCINSPYYDEYIPGVLREIIERSHPEGITDNSWSGLGRDSICYCDNCERRFRATDRPAHPARGRTGTIPLYRQWILWNYDRRTGDLGPEQPHDAGRGRPALPLGRHEQRLGHRPRRAGSATSRRSAAAPRSCMLDHQARDDATGFQQNGDTGKRVHGLLGWDKLAPESMAMYQAGRTVLPRARASPQPEARMWMIEGFAGGIQPWWHHVGAYQEDRRMYPHRRAADAAGTRRTRQYLVNRQPVASVGVVWSQRNTDFYGRDERRRTGGRSLPRDSRRR